MLLKSSVIIGVIIATLVLPTIPVSASEDKPEQTQIYVEEEKERESGFYREDGYPRDTEDRPAINPDFAPDRSCDLKWELKCIPGSEQKCSDLRGYNNGEMNVCTPIGCPEGYHNIFEDEDNICHSNEIDCPNDLVLVTGAYGDQCVYKTRDAELPICVYKEIKDCKTRSGLICKAGTTIDPCQDIFHGFTGTDENYKPETNQFIVPNN